MLSLTVMVIWAYINEQPGQVIDYVGYRYICWLCMVVARSLPKIDCRFDLQNNTTIETNTYIYCIKINPNIQWSCNGNNGLKSFLYTLEYLKIFNYNYCHSVKLNEKKWIQNCQIRQIKINLLLRSFLKRTYWTYKVTCIEITAKETKILLKYRNSIKSEESKTLTRLELEN